MKRVYASFVAVFLLPQLLLVLLLEHYEIVTGIDSIDRYLRTLHLLLALSSARHPEFWWWIIGVLALGFVSFTAADWLTELWSRDIVKRIAELLDRDGPGAPGISSRWDRSRFYVSTRGRFHRRDVDATLRVSYAERVNCNWLRISFACRAPWPFRIEQKSLNARVMELFGPPHAPIGDAALDEHLLFVADDHAFSTWVREPENLRAVLALMVEHGVSSIEAKLDDGPVLQVTSARVSFFRRGLILRGLQKILDAVERLADSLENHAAPGTSVAAEPHEPGSETSTGWSDARRARRRTAQALVVSGVLLLTGLPGTLLSGRGGQPSYALTCLLAVFPWLGVAMLIAGVRSWRRP